MSPHSIHIYGDQSVKALKSTQRYLSLVLHKKEPKKNSIVLLFALKKSINEKRGMSLLSFAGKLSPCKNVPALDIMMIIVRNVQKGKIFFCMTFALFLDHLLLMSCPCQWMDHCFEVLVLLGTLAGKSSSPPCSEPLLLGFPHLLASCTLPCTRGPTSIQTVSRFLPRTKWQVRQKAPNWTKQ